MNIAKKTSLIFTSILLGSFLFSCAKQVEKKVKVKAVIRLNALAEYGGGGFLMGKNSKGDSFSHYLGNNSVEMFLPNDSNWKFIAFAWSGTSGPMTGNTFCDVKNGINLNGADTNLSFNLATGKCHDPVFGMPKTKEASGKFKNLTFSSCDGFDLMVAEAVAQGDSIDPLSMTDAPNCEREMGKDKSFRLEVFPYGLTKNPNSTLLPAVVSDCFGNISAANNILNSVLTLPSLDPSQFKMNFKVQAFDGNNCTGTLNQVNFPNGTAVLAAGNRGMLTSMASAGTNTLTLDSQLCTGSWGTNTSSFADGTVNVSNNGQYVICNVDQLNHLASKINSGQGNNTNSFSIGESFSLNGFSVPIGNSTFPFNSTFNGRGRRLYNLITSFSHVNSGLFGVCADCKIRSVYIDNAQFTNTMTSSRSGILIGKLDLSTGSNQEVEIEDILIENSSMVNQANMPINGGLIGEIALSSSSHNEVRIREVELNNVIVSSGTGANSAYTGGKREK